MKRIRNCAAVLIVFGLCVALPARARAEEAQGYLGGVVKGMKQGKATACMSHLKDVGIAIMLYQTVFDRSPARLEDLVTCFRTGLSPLQLYCSLDAARRKETNACTDGADSAPEESAKRLEAWFAKNPPDYVYVLKNMRLDAPDPAGLVTVFEREPRHDNARHVLFLDGHVERVQEEKFQQMAKEQGLLPAPPRTRQEPTKELSAEIDAKIRELGAEDFRVREAATKRLIEIGPAATDALKKAQENPDVEIQSRSTQILETFREDEAPKPQPHRTTAPNRLKIRIIETQPGQETE